MMIGVGMLMWVMVGWCCWGVGIEASKVSVPQNNELRAAVVVNQLVLENVANLLMDMVNTTLPNSLLLRDPGSDQEAALVLDPQEAIHNLTKAVTHTFDQMQQVTGLMMQTLGKLLEVTESLAARETTGLDVPKDCPAPFFRVNSECFYVHLAHPLTWHEATSFCQRLGGDLAEPLTVELLGAVLNQRPEVNQELFWIGASDVRHEGHWKWTSGLAVDHTQMAWKHSEPNNANGVEDCLVLDITIYPFLNDYTCSSKCHFVCELQMDT